MGWNDWLNVVLAPHPLTHRAEEVEREVNAELAGALQSRLRGRIDPGIVLGGGARAEAIRVAAEGNRLVIDEGEDHGVAGHPARARRTELEDLFHTSLAPPEVLDDGRVAFRVIDEDAVPGATGGQDELVDRTVQEVMNEQFVDALERAARKVELEHTADKASR
jgi:hypothetical protein